MDQWVERRMDGRSCIHKLSPVLNGQIIDGRLSVFSFFILNEYILVRIINIHKTLLKPLVVLLGQGNW